MGEVQGDGSNDGSKEGEGMRKTTSVARRATVSLVAACLAASTVVSDAAAGPRVTTRRLSGADRYETAAAIALATFPEGPGPSRVSNAVLARGDVFADALVANGVATVHNGATLLTPPEELHAATRDALQTLGVRRVVILGDASAISPDVERVIVEELGIETRRYGGETRYDTQEQVYSSSSEGYGEEGSLPGTYRNKYTAVVASGADFADALAGGPVAYAENFPLLLTPPDHLAPQTKDTLERIQIGHVLLLGGHGAVSAEVEEQIRTFATVTRISGPNRWATAVAVADFAVNELGWVPDHVNLARGDVFADAVAGGAHAGQEQDPILLIESRDSVGDDALRFIRSHNRTIMSIDAYGGHAAITDEAIEAAREAAQYP